MNTSLLSRPATTLGVDRIRNQTGGGSGDHLVPSCIRIVSQSRSSLRP